MPSFSDVDELNRYIGGIFEEAFRDETVGPKLAATGMSLRMNFTEPDAAITIDLANRKILSGDDALVDADAVLNMSSETANGYWQGKVSLPLAMAKGKLTIGGSAAQLLKLAPIAKDLHPRYVSMLKADGREDLIVA